MEKDFTTRPYAKWLEDVVREMVGIDPVSVGMEMIDADGQVYTCYYNTSRDDRACMIGGMEDADKLDWIKVNKALIMEILNEDDDDGLCEADTEADSEG